MPDRNAQETRLCAKIRFAQSLVSEKYQAHYLVKVALTLMSTPVNAFETGQPLRDSSTFSWNNFSSTPGTVAWVSSWMVVIFGAPSTRSRWTVAVVWICCG